MRREQAFTSLVTRPSPEEEASHLAADKFLELAMLASAHPRAFRASSFSPLVVAQGVTLSTVTDIDMAIEQARGEGWEPIIEKAEVPHGGWFALYHTPGGEARAIIQPRSTRFLRHLGHARGPPETGTPTQPQSNEPQGPPDRPAPVSVDVLAQSLGRVQIFSRLTNHHLRRLAREARVCAYPAGVTVQKEGEKGAGVYILLQGGVELRHGGHSLSTLGPGQSFGEMALLDDQPLSVDVVTTLPTEAAVLSKWEFWGFAGTEPEALRSILKEMARRLEEANRALSE